MGKQWKQWQTIFYWAPKITADGDCSHEIKRCLLLGRKAMTNLDSVSNLQKQMVKTNKWIKKIERSKHAKILFLYINSEPRYTKQRLHFATNIHIVKAMVFPVVMYGCESWPIKMAESQWIDYWTVVLEKTLESSLGCCKEIKPVNPKGNQSWILTGRTVAKAEAPILGHLMWRTDSLEKTLMLGKIENRMRRGWKRMRSLDDITDSMNKTLSKL